MVCTMTRVHVEPPRHHYSIPCNDNISVTSPIHQDWPCSPHSLLVSRYWVLLPQAQSRRGVKLITQIQPVLQVRINGASLSSPVLLHWHAHEQLYLYLYLNIRFVKMHSIL